MERLTGKAVSKLTKSPMHVCLKFRGNTLKKKKDNEVKILEKVNRRINLAQIQNLEIVKKLTST